MSGAAASFLRVRSFDGVELHVEERGAGPAIVFVHELLGNGATFAPVIERLQDRFRCITFNARGYPPSAVPPPGLGTYSEASAQADLLAVLDRLGLERAQLVGVSMGAACCLKAAIAHPKRVQAMVLASIGSGSDQAPEAQAAQIEALAAQFEQSSLAELLQAQAARPNRRTLAANEPRSWELFQREFLRLDPLGVAGTLQGVQLRRAPLYALERPLRSLDLPLLVVLGSEDEPCRKPCEFLARTLPNARLEVLAGSGHTPNLEQPDAFARLLADFFAGARA
jgi:pimeloyl-ACP methyl ester carboxylesterase